MAGTAEDLLADWQQQVDEVQALEAIFGDDFRLVAADGLAADASAGQALDAAALAAAEPPPCCSSKASSSGGSSAWALDCSLLVRVDLHSGSLRLQLSGSRESDGGPAGCSDDSQPCSSGRGSEGGYAVQHLPPICMQLRLTPGYPSQQQPEVSLSGLWLSASQAAELEAQLAALWQEQGPGLPVCYIWADWLQSSTLQHLGASEVLLLAGLPSGQQTGEPASGGSAADSQGDAAADEEGPEDRLLKLLR